MSRKSKSRSVSDSSWQAFVDRHRSTNSSSESDSESFVVKPRFTSQLFSSPSLSSFDQISPRAPRKRRRTSLDLSFEKKRRRTPTKRWVALGQVANSSKNKFEEISSLVPYFTKHFQKILNKKFSSIADFIFRLLQFQRYLLEHFSPIVRDEFNSLCFQLTGLKGQKLLTEKKSGIKVKHPNMALFTLKGAVETGTWEMFDKFSKSFYQQFFTISESQAKDLWSTLEKLSPPLRRIYWYAVDTYAPARFFIQPHLQSAFVQTFSLAPSSTSQYKATLARFSNFVNETLDKPFVQKQAKIEYTLTQLRRCDPHSYTLIQGWLLKQMARGLGFTSIRTYCLHLSWFQQPDERRYSKSQHFKRFLIDTMSRFFTDSHCHGADPMDQETLNAFWKVFDKSSFSEAQYDKHGFAWMLQVALRTIEGINNQWHNVDFNDNQIGVIQRLSNSKNSKKFGKLYILALQANNTQFCPVKCLTYLAENGNSNFVFYDRKRNRGWTSKTLNKRFQKYVQKLPKRLRKNKKFSVYSLRSTFACTAFQANVDFDLIRQMMRHKAHTSTQTYCNKAFPHLNFADILSKTASEPITPSFENSFLSNLTTSRILSP